MNCIDTGGNGRRMKIKELLSGPEKWCQHTMAVDAAGNPIPALSNNAVAFCLVGAVARCYPNDAECGAVYQKLYFAAGTTRLVEFNDGSSFKDVRRIVEQADV